jgi:predicted aldo/keto reductase-like oxidoreductase
MERSAAGAERELNISLNRVGVDHFDLYQLHAVTTMEEVEAIFAADGAVETFIKAQKEGKIRYIGFSAHSEEAALALLDRFEFNSVLFPVNFVNYARSNFGPVVVDRARSKGAAVLALKSMAYTPWPERAEKTCEKCWYKPVEKPDLAEKALRFTLSQDITAAIPPGDENLYRLALSIARSYQPMDSTGQAELLASTNGLKPLFPL